MLTALDAEAIRRWSLIVASSLDEHRAEIDELNVFPVPDRDTGTNLALTLRAAADALAADTATGAGAALGAYARGAVLGARGNSGVIMSQLLRGIAEAADGSAECDAATLRAGLVRGALEARDAVADPVDGTILTVAGAVAETLPNGGTTLAELTRAAAVAAGEALAHTPEQLPVLATAGVVDAGGRGLVLLLDALAHTVDDQVPRATAALPPRAGAVPWSVRETGSGEFGFEVQYLLDAAEPALTGLRDRLAALGDSVVVVGTGQGVWNVHAHVNDVGAAIEAGVEAGRPHGISVARFADQLAASATQRGGTALVAIVPTAGVAALFEAEGVRVVDGTGEGGPPVVDVVAAVRATGVAEVVLLPNAAWATQVAESAARVARDEGIRVTVVPTRSPVQGLAAVAVHDPARRFDDDVVAMAEAAAATRFAEVALAQGESLTSVGVCQAGDTLGLIDGEVVEIGRGLVAMAFALVDRLLGVGAELVTVLVGEDAPAGLGELIRRHVLERAPLTEVSVYPCGGPGSPLIIGAE